MPFSIFLLPRARGMGLSRWFSREHSGPGQQLYHEFARILYISLDRTVACVTRYGTYWTTLWVVGNNYIYEVLCKGNDINLIINMAASDKSLLFNPIEYCKKEFDFDTGENREKNENLRDYIRTMDPDTVKISELTKKFEIMHKPLQDLYRKSTNKITELEAKISAINSGL